MNSPVRAFRGVGGTPLFFTHGEGAIITDADGNEYIDCIGSWGPHILGHSHPRIIEVIRKQAGIATSFGAPTELEIELAELICNLVPSVELVRMVNSGTEATMSAVRLARAYTKREKIIKFSGCYHGHGDSFLINAGSGMLTMGVPSSQGVTEGTAHDTLTARYNDLDSVKSLLQNNSGAIAAIIVEPIAGNMGAVPPAEGFLPGLRNLCTAESIVLIFDEVISGFRASLGGAQSLYNVKPDLTTLGKIIGGAPVGAFGGKKEIMQLLAPECTCLSGGNAFGESACHSRRHRNAENPARREPISSLEENGAFLEDSLNEIITQNGIPASVNRVGSLLTLFFTATPVCDYECSDRRIRNDSHRISMQC